MSKSPSPAAAVAPAPAPALPRPARVAVFDSGVGGLTVVAAVRRRLPWLDVRFLGDTARLPYGTKSAETVVKYALQASARLLDVPADALVVACNTASACALPALRARHGLPVLGVVEPGARAAVAATLSGHIGVIGTERTVASGAYPAAIAALAPDARVHVRATPLLVSLAEEGWFDHPAAEATLRAYFGPWLAEPDVAQIDTLVLGCTHYPVFKPLIARVVTEILGRPVALVDSADAVSNDLAALLAAPALPDRPGATQLCATDSLDRFLRVGGLFFDVASADACVVDL
ncbi:MAG: glutamate racemase [Myxococcales bacterium]|nr:glutamate racemase [Myxococcales bacterium]